MLIFLTALAAVSAHSKTDPVRELALAVFLNSVDRPSDLFRACDHSNFKALAWALKGVEPSVNRPKSEFETDAEFVARNQKLEQIINAGRRLIVCQPLNDNDDAPFTYDADRQVFKGTFQSQQNVWRDTKRIGKYVSHTRMGVRATVTASLDLEYNVDMADAYRRADANCIKWDISGAEYEVPVPRADAPTLKAKGYLAFVGRLASPFFDSSSSSGSPTLDDPTDIHETDLTVHFTPEEMSVVGPAGATWTCRLKSE